MLDASITALHPSGFAVVIHLHNKEYDEVDATIHALELLGYRPTSGAGDGWQHTAEGIPLCPKHKVPMRLRQKQGDEWWSHQVIDVRTGEELYCRGYAGPTSPGWALPA